MPDKMEDKIAYIIGKQAIRICALEALLEEAKKKEDEKKQGGTA